MRSYWLIFVCPYSKIDKLGLDYISQEEFRAAMESRFNLEISDAQFEGLIDKVPLDEEGNVKYAEFMAQFDTRSVADRCAGVSDMWPIVVRTS